MVYVITVSKAIDINSVEFLSALNCSANSVESVLSDYDVQVTVKEPNRIHISLQENSEVDEIPFSVNKCKKLTKGSFTNSEGIGVFQGSCHLLLSI